MQLSDTKTDYGWISIALHWAVFVLVAALFVIGQQMEDLRPNTELGGLLRGLHVSIGMLAGVLIVARIFWRVSRGVPEEPGSSPLLTAVAALVRYALLAVLVALIVTGPLAVWSGGRDLSIFQMITLPSPMGRIEWLHEGLEEIHEFAANALLPLVGLHVLGALKHLVLDRDGRFQAMLRPRRLQA